MATMKYKDEQGNWVPLILGGPDEVSIQADIPADHTDLWVDINDDSGGSGGGEGGPSVTDHGQLTGLADDDHHQYARTIVSTADPVPGTDVPDRDGILWITVEA